MNSNFSRSSFDLKMKAVEIAQKLRSFGSQSYLATTNFTSQNTVTHRSSDNAKTTNDKTKEKPDRKSDEWHQVVNKISPVKFTEEKNEEDPKGPVANPSELRIFVKNLSPNTTEDKLKSYFSRWGVVTDVCIRKPDKTWIENNTNMAFITFDHYYNGSPRSIPVHVIDGMRVPIYLIGTMASSRHPRIESSNSIMITGAIHRSPESEIRKTFSKFGTIAKITRKPDPENRQQSLRYAFILFNDTKSVDKIIEASASIKVGGQIVDVRRVKNAY